MPRASLGAVESRRRIAGAATAFVVAATSAMAPSCRSPPEPARTAATIDDIPAAAAAAGRRASGAEPDATPTARTSQEPVDLPIDLPTVLRLAGADNLEIHYVRERVAAARARLEGASTLWLPSITLGAAYDKHDGRLQDVQGEVIEVSRNSGFAGGGVSATIPVSDAIFEPLAARRDADAEQAFLERTVNDTLLEAALAYLELCRAEGRSAISRADLENARTLVGLAERFARAGEGLESDAARARGEEAVRQGELEAAEEARSTSSARLARVLRLDPTVVLHALDSPDRPLDLIPESAALGDLIAQALERRPETRELENLVEAARLRRRQELLRPFLPSLRVSATAGGFGGGTGSDFENFDDRTDFAAGLLWELRQLGFGDVAAVQVREAELRQAAIRSEQTRDAIAAEVVVAYRQIEHRRRQIEIARRGVESAVASLELNLQRIRANEGLPIEALQAVQAVAVARRAHVEAVIGVSSAQIRLLRSIGKPPLATAAPGAEHSSSSAAEAGPAPRAGAGS